MHRFISFCAMACLLLFTCLLSKLELNLPQQNLTVRQTTATTTSRQSRLTRSACLSNKTETKTKQLPSLFFCSWLVFSLLSWGWQCLHTKTIEQKDRFSFRKITKEIFTAVAGEQMRCCSICIRLVKKSKSTWHITALWWRRCCVSSAGTSQTFQSDKEAVRLERVSCHQWEGCSRQLVGRCSPQDIRLVIPRVSAGALSSCFAPSGSCCFDTQTKKTNMLKQTDSRRWFVSTSRGTPVFFHLWQRSVPEPTDILIIIDSNKSANIWACEAWIGLGLAWKTMFHLGKRVERQLHWTLARVWSVGSNYSFQL